MNPSNPPAPTEHVPKVGSGEAVIAARRVSLWYGSVIGVNNISLDIGQGVIGLLGPNGAGKSTLLKCLTGQLNPRTGGVRIHGKPVWNNAEVFAQIGLVPEQDAFYEEMTGREFVTYLTQLQGFSKKDAQQLADEAIETVDLTDKRDKAIREYSKGMRQRIKIAQALAHRPSVLFLDEPLAGTDPVGRRHIINMIRELGEQGKTIVVSSHVLNEVESMTTDIVLINRGRIVADGNVYRIREMIDEHPHTIFVDASDVRLLASLLAAFEDVVSLDFGERGLQISTTNPDACYARIPELVLEHGLTLRGMTSPDNNLMAVFKYLVG